MENDVDMIIAALRNRLGAKNDADLGRKLRVAKSTISSWRARGIVPNRYTMILDGASHQMILVPPNSWSVQETLAFNLALFRFTRATPKVARWDDYRANLDLFLNGDLIFILASECQKEIADLIDMRGYDPETAFALVLHEDIAQGEKAIDQTAKKIREYNPRISPDI